LLAQSNRNTYCWQESSVYHVRFYPPRGSRTIIHVLIMRIALRVKHNMGDIVRVLSMLKGYKQHKATPSLVL